jgi:hypothetical protein
MSANVFARFTAPVSYQLSLRWHVEERGRSTRLARGTLTSANYPRDTDASRSAADQYVLLSPPNDGFATCEMLREAKLLGLEQPTVEATIVIGQSFPQRALVGLVRGQSPDMETADWVPVVVDGVVDVRKNDFHWTRGTLFLFREPAPNSNDS